jgi:hypothetical protein
LKKNKTTKGADMEFLLRAWRFDDVDSIVKYANNPKIAANLRNGFILLTRGKMPMRFCMPVSTMTSACALSALLKSEERRSAASGFIGMTMSIAKLPKWDIGSGNRFGETGSSAVPSV